MLIPGHLKRIQAENNHVALKRFPCLALIYCAFKKLTQTPYDISRVKFTFQQYIEYKS